MDCQHLNNVCDSDYITCIKCIRYNSVLHIKCMHAVGIIYYLNSGNILYVTPPSQIILMIITFLMYTKVHTRK